MKPPPSAFPRPSSGAAPDLTLNELRVLHSRDVHQGAFVREYETIGGIWCAPTGPAHTIVGMAATPILTEFSSGNRKHVFEYAPGEGVVIPQGVAHCTVTRRWQRFVHCALSQDFIRHVARRTRLPFRLPRQFIDCVFPSAHPIMTLLRLIHAESVSARPLTPSLENLTRLLATELLRLGDLSVNPRPSPGAVPPAVQRALRLITADPRATPSLAELATVSRLSEFHFSRVFRRATGHSPRQYLIRLRIERAAQLIQAAGYGAKLSTIAHATGFSDQSHFTRHFVRLVGTSPGDYRRHSFPVHLTRSAATL